MPSVRRALLPSAVIAVMEWPDHDSTGVRCHGDIFNPSTFFPTPLLHTRGSGRA